MDHAAHHRFSHQGAGVRIERRDVRDNDGTQDQIRIRALATVFIPYGEDTIETTLWSPGSWGVEPDMSESYKSELYREERRILLDMLESLRGIELPD